jgi:hypothetical protein
MDPYGLGKDDVLGCATSNGCRDTQHPTWRVGLEKLFSGDQVVGRQKPAHYQEFTPRYFRGLCSMSRLICMIFVADLIACRLYLMSAV